jgi:hypothetical protein
VQRGKGTIILKIAQSLFHKSIATLDVGLTGVSLKQESADGVLFAADFTYSSM